MIKKIMENINNMAKIELNSQVCKKCGKCIFVCPAKIFEEKEGKCPRVKIERLEKCIECGHCSAICESQAISINGHPVGHLVPLHHEDSFNKLSRIIQNRRSIRNYKDELVPKEKIEEIIQLTRWMPTARNLCPVKWTVIHNPEKVRMLSGMVVKLFEKNEMLPEIVTAWNKGIDIINRGAPHLVICHTKENAMLPKIDSTIALTAFDLAASARGYGTCWAGFFMMASRDDPNIAKACGIPADETIHAAMMLGVPTFRYKNIPDRKKLKINWQS